MFLIRAAFWLSLVVFLLPADPQTGEQAPRVTAMQALVAAQSTVADLSGFCDRNADVCTTGGDVFQVFTDKVRYGVHLLKDYLDPAPTAASSDTLKREDRQLPWHAVAKNDRPA